MRGAPRNFYGKDWFITALLIGFSVAAAILGIFNKVSR